MLRYLGNGIYKFLSSDPLPINPVPDSILIETNTRKTYYYQGGTWVQAPPTTLAALTGDVTIAAPANDQLLRYNTSLSKWQNATVTTGGGTSTDNPYTWYIYKVGTSNTYKAKNGSLGTAPTTIGGVANPNSSMDALWGAIRSNFNLAGEETHLLSEGGSNSGAGGSIVFGRGVFTFTNEMLVDSTMTGGARAPAIYAQSKGGTTLRFIASAPLTSAIHIKSMVEPVLKDLDIWVNDSNVITNIIHVDAMTGASAGGLFENIRIFKTINNPNYPATEAWPYKLNYFPSPLPPTGQRGFYLQQGTNPPPATDNSTNTMHFAEFRKILIKDTDIGFESVGIGNNSFMKFDGIYLWHCKQGFKGDSEFKQSFLNNFIYQAGQAGAYGDYCISILGTSNCISNVTTDVIEPPFATVILQPGATQNRISNIVNSGLAPDILDLSGNITNMYPVCNTSNGLSQPSRESRRGEWLATQCQMPPTTSPHSAADGALINGFDVFKNSTAWTIGEDAVTTNLIGKAVTFTSPAIGWIGLRSVKALVKRRWNPTFTAKWQCSGTTNTRFFIGFAGTQFTDSVLPGSDDTPIPDNTAAIGIGKGTATGFYKIIQGDTLTTAPAPQDIKNNANASVASDVNAHRVWIHLNEEKASAYIALDNHKSNVVTTQIPDTDNTMYIVAFVESPTGSAKTLTLGKMTLELSR